MNALKIAQTVITISAASNVAPHFTCTTINVYLALRNARIAQIIAHAFHVLMAFHCRKKNAYHVVIVLTV